MWRFYQGLRNEWRWYRFDDKGAVIAQSDQGFAELRGCMANGESAGFTGGSYQVLARQTSDDILPVGICTEPMHEPAQARAAPSQRESDAPAV